MPRQLKEIKNFNLGTILNVSEKDIPEDAAAYSLNVNPLSESGILSAINSDKYVFNTDLSDLIIDKICPIGNKIIQLLKEKDHLISILKKGREKAEARAIKKLDEINEKVGFLNIS